MILNTNINKTRRAKVLSALAAVVLAAGALSGCAGPAPAQTGEEHEGLGHEGQVHEAKSETGEEGHDHGEDGEEYGADLGMGLEEIVAARCEHDTRTYLCSECRYEVGVVRLDPALTEALDGHSALVRFETVARTAARSLLETTGEVGLDENQTARVSSPVFGVVSSVTVDVGQEVKAGEVLFEVRSAEVAGTLAEYRRASELVSLAGRNYRRDRDLHAKGISSEEEMVESRMTYRGHGSDLESARQRLLALGLAEDDFDGNPAGSLPVRAARAGTVISRTTSVNETVEPGQELMVVSALDRLWVWADLYERDLARLPSAPGQPEVEIICDAFPGRKFAGRLEYVGAVMDHSTRTVKARIAAENPDRALRSGMFCQILVPLVSDPLALLVPREAVLSDEGREFVFKRLEDDYWVRREVATGRDFGGRVEILEGLVAGEVIVTDGAFLLKSDVLREKMGAGCAD